MSAKVSIILISYNKYPLNLFTLYSLEKQTFDPGKMEVILVDDNSTDRTNSLKRYKAPFCFKYLYSPENLDRAGAKNLGIREAEGEIVIFLDAEVLVAPDFVANHLRHYSTGEEIAVSGNLSHFSIFSFLYPGFARKQLRLLHSCLQKEPLLMERAAQLLGVPSEELRFFDKFRQHVIKSRQPVALLTREDIAGGQFKQLSVPAWHFFSGITQKYGPDLSGFYLSWIFFITRNVSVRKRIFSAIGLFNEAFKGWGSEDWEFGYRLYKNGVKFIEDREIVSYHQEHPFSMSHRVSDKMRNYTKFMALHPEIEVCAVALNFLRKRRFIQINRIIADYYRLNEELPKQFIYSQEVFIKLTQQIPLLLSEGKPVTRLWQHVGLEKEPCRRKLLAELEALRKTGRYRHYLSAYDLLLSL